MDAQVTVVVPAVAAKSEKYDFDSYRMEISGRASKGSRCVSLAVDVVDDAGNVIRTQTAMLKGDAFNAFWSAFTSDKAVATALFTSLGITADVSLIPDSIVNQ